MDNARIKVPDEAKRGDIVEIRLLIRHPMETGFRYDNVGKPIPKNVVNRLVCRYNGNEIMRGEFSSGIAANPYFSFYAVAEASGEIDVSWEDDTGASGSISAMLQVIG